MNNINFNKKNDNFKDKIIDETLIENVSGGCPAGSTQEFCSNHLGEVCQIEIEFFCPDP